MTRRVIGNATLYLGDCLEVLRTLADNSIDSIVTDPPYGLAFMGKRWDYDVPSQAIWEECLRVLKPGGHLLAFAGTRTQHRMAVRIEDAGFEIRDMIAWVYGSGFPKSLDVSKAIDKAAGAEREVVGENPNHRAVSGVGYKGVYRGGDTCAAVITAPATNAARQWQGWWTALKPALEPITVARKPLVGTVAENVLQFGTGALNIDACRIAGSDNPVKWDKPRGGIWSTDSEATGTLVENTAGRWPANLIHDGSEEVVGLFPDVKAGTAVRHNSGGNTFGGSNAKPPMPDMGYADAGSAARFFYCAKASKRDREEGLEHMEAVHRPNGNKWTDQDYRVARGERPPSAESGPRKNIHPTVKPTDLMRYLCRLVTPPGGVVLDPFMGSGSTGKAAIREGFRFIGIEREPSYFDIACERIRKAYAQPDVFVSKPKATETQEGLAF